MADPLFVCIHSVESIHPSPDPSLGHYWYLHMSMELLEFLLWAFWLRRPSFWPFLNARWAREICICSFDIGPHLDILARKHAPCKFVFFVVIGCGALLECILAWLIISCFHSLSPVDASFSWPWSAPPACILGYYWNFHLTMTLLNISLWAICPRFRRLFVMFTAADVVEINRVFSMQGELGEHIYVAWWWPFLRHSQVCQSELG